MSARTLGPPYPPMEERLVEELPEGPEWAYEPKWDDHFTGGRFRHGTRFLRWRPDKKPRQCTMDQVTGGQRRGSAEARLVSSR